MDEIIPAGSSREQLQGLLTDTDSFKETIRNHEGDRIEAGRVIEFHNLLMRASQSGVYIDDLVVPGQWKPGEVLMSGDLQRHDTETGDKKSLNKRIDEVQRRVKASLAVMPEVDVKSQ